MRRAIPRPPLTALGTDQLSDLELYHLRRHRLDRITSACSSSSTFLTTSWIVILSTPAIAGSFSSLLWKPDDHGRHDGRNRLHRFRPIRSYTNPRDVTGAVA